MEIRGPINEERIVGLRLVLDVGRNFVDGRILEVLHRLAAGDRVDLSSTLALFADEVTLDFDTEGLAVFLQPGKIVEGICSGNDVTLQVVVLDIGLEIHCAVVEAVVGVVVALVLRRVLGQLTQVPFAPHRRVITGLRQDLGNGDLLR